MAGEDGVFDQVWGGGGGEGGGRGEVRESVKGRVDKEIMVLYYFTVWDVILCLEVYCWGQTISRRPNLLSMPFYTSSSRHLRRP